MQLKNLFPFETQKSIMAGKSLGEQTNLTKCFVVVILYLFCFFAAMFKSRQAHYPFKILSFWLVTSKMIIVDIHGHSLQVVSFNPTIINQLSQ